MPRTTSQPILLVACPVCYQLHPQQHWGSCEDQQNSYRSVEDYTIRHAETKSRVEVLDFA